MKKLLVALCIFAVGLGLSMGLSNVQAEPEPEPTGYDIMAKLEEMDAKIDELNEQVNILVQFGDFNFLELDEFETGYIAYEGQEQYIIEIDELTMYFFYIFTQGEVTVTLSDIDGNLLGTYLVDGRSYINPVWYPGTYLITFEQNVKNAMYFNFSMSTDWDSNYSSHYARFLQP